MKDTQELIKEIDQYLKENLSEKRYNHSVGVMKKAEELAKRYNVDVDKSKITGLAHDIAKEIPNDEKVKYANEHGIEIDEIEAENIQLLHGKIGADICKEKYDFSEDMQKAIAYHTVANPKMDDLAKIVFIADKIEDGRKNIDFEAVKQVQEQGIDALLIHVLDNSLKSTITKGRKIHPDSVYTRNKFLKG